MTPHPVSRAIVNQSVLFETRPLAVVAEDDPEIQSALSQFLVVVGYDVVSVSNGSDMLEALANSLRDDARDPDVIVTDVRMPGLNGVSIAEMLRADGWQQSIVIISAYGDDELLLSRVRRIPRCVFFAKPLNPTLLEDTLVELRHSRSVRLNRLHVR